MSWSTPVNIMANVLDHIQEDPQAQQMAMLGVGMAYDVMKHVPVDLMSTLPHYETEVDESGSTRPAVQPV